MVKAFSESINTLTTLGMSRVGAFALTTGVMIFILVIGLVLYILLFRLLRKVTHLVFRRLERKQGHRIHIEFLERITSFGIGLAVIISFLGWKNIGGSLLGSAAVLTGVIGFAAQDVIKDVLSGLLISIYRPFDLGDRIELEDGTVGIVESITMRHVVISRIDTLRMIIPNSRINAASILNYSFGDIQRSCHFRFPVAYETDIEKAKKVISDAVKSSPYSVPGKKQSDGSMDYGSIYFIDLSDSALVMAVTVYYEASIASEKLKDDINTRVFEALTRNGIEIPYNHTSVVLKKEI
ncbi:MAG: mechanosensitive ion channel family protein [Lachnospiraceae bacterium]|nr:mechanosensitive ion channel family protein [Lachnospiraceae bacterium]